MADNTELNVGSGGDIIATDDLGGGVKVQRVKQGFGPDGSYADVSASNPLPVTLGASNLGVTLGALNAVAPVAVQGASSVGFNVTAGLTGTIKFQLSYDNGSAWIDTNAWLLTIGLTAARPLGGSAVQGMIDCLPGVTHVQVLVSAYTSGSALCNISATNTVAPRLLPGNTTPVAGDFFSVTGIHPSANRVQVNDGTTTITVKAASTASVASDSSLVVAMSPNSGAVADNTTFTDGTTRVLMAGFIFDETAGTALTENDAAAARIDSKRAVVGVIEDATTRGRRVTVTAGGAMSVEDSASLVDNASFVDGTSRVLAAGFVFDDVAGTALTENDVAAARIDSKRALIGVIEDGTTRGQRAAVSAGGALKVDGSATTQPISGSVTADTELPAAAALADGAANPTAPMVGSAILGYNGSSWDRVRIGSNFGLSVAGDVAHSSGDSGNPVKVGAKSASSAWPSESTSASRVDAIADRWGRILVSHLDPGLQVWKSYNTTSTATGAVIWDPTSTKRIAITHLTIGTYGTQSARVILWFGANGDTSYTAGTDQLVFAGSFAPSTSAKPGAVVALNTPIFCSTADHELHITTDNAISIDVTVYGYEW